jgi:hypothetical protein
MMYSDKLVTCIKVHGKILREQGSVVKLPFGSEYSVLVKNLDSVRAQIKVNVDGIDATEGTQLIIPANGQIELERYIRNGNMDSGNKFKFIERTEGIESNRGIKADDGIVRVEAWREKVTAVVDETIVRHNYYDEWYPVPRPYSPWRPYPHYPYPYRYGGMYSSTHSYNSNISHRRPMSRPGASASAGRRSLHPPTRSGGTLRQMSAMNTSLNDTGITVPGSQSNQVFQWTSGFPLHEQSIVMVLHLRGEVGGKVVAVPVTVNAKPRCETCGRVNKGTAQFCSQCGTSLNLI